MLGKAATHIRPLLRLQSHATHQPDLFTSNPSLLHHFQPAGVSNSLVAAQNAQTASGSSGAAGGAGRGGYSGASNGGGYTGQARAFMSLPQGPAADASSLGGSAEEKKNEAAAARQRAHLALKQRIAHRDDKPTTRVVMLSEKMQARGARQVKLVEMEAAPAVEDAPAPKRPSIAYPTWAALPAEATPGGALWLPGAAPRPLGARAFHSRARPQLVTATPAPETNRIEQPNRVLMDLAGLDIARPTSPTRTQIRRNSTASLTRHSPTDDAFLPQQTADNDTAIYEELQRLANEPGSLSREQLMDVIAHYRTPRGEQPASDVLASQLPLPAGFTTATYNACLNAVISKRNRGESIAIVLDMYNEMLQRDVIPNYLTTKLVIRALCLREEDVAAASRRWAQDIKWAAFKADKLSIHSHVDEKAAEAIEAYQSEQNLASALKLYNVALKFYPKERVVGLARDIISAAATVVGLPFAVKAETILEVITDALRAQDISHATFCSIFEILAAVGADDPELVISVWNRFLDSNTRGNKDQDTRSPTRAGIAALVACGQIDMVTELAKPSAKAKRSRFAAGEPAAFMTSAAVKALAIHGHVDAAFDLLQAAKASTLVPSDMYDIARALAAAGRLEDSSTVISAINTAISTNYPGKYTDRFRLTLVWGEAVAHVVSLDKEARIAAYPALEKILYSITVRPEPALFKLQVALAVEAGKASEIGHIVSRIGVNTVQASLHETDVEILREMFSQAVFADDVTLSQVLFAARTFRRLHIPMHSDLDPRSIAQRIVEMYMAERAKADGPVLSSSQEWFRLTEAVASLPPAFIESGDADAPLEAIMTDYAANTRSRGAPATIVSEIAAMLSYRLGVDRAAELLSAAFGDDATPFLPTPEASIGAESEHTFSLPPTPASDATPPTNLQPPSAHTLHISPKLDQLIERLIFPSSNTSPDRVYNAIRKALTQTNEVPSPQGLGRLIASIARAGDEPKARELYSLAQVVLASCVPEPAAQAEGWRTVEDGMIAACCFLGHLEQAGMHRARIIEAGMVPAPDSYATMIASSRDSTDEALVARELFEESQAMGVVPNLYLYNTIISKLSKARKAEMALELFNRMKAQRIRPSSVTYGAVINACCRVGDAESAANLFEEMSAQRNFRPRVPPFNTMMQLHLQTRPSRELVLKYYDAMRAANVRPSAHTYKLLLDAYGSLAPIDLAAMDRVFGDLCRDRQVAVQGTHWASLITAFGIHAGDLDRAIAIFESIPSHPSTRANSTVEPVVWEAILNVVGQVGSLEQLSDLHAQLSASLAQSTAYVCNVLIHGYARHGALDRARDVFEAMADSQTGFAAPNNHPALLTSSGHAKPATITTEPTGVVFREPSTYEAMIRAELMAGNREAAEAVLGRMEDRRYPVAVWMKARAIIDEAIVNPAPTSPAPASPAEA